MKASDKSAEVAASGDKRSWKLVTKSANDKNLRALCMKQKI